MHGALPPSLHVLKAKCLSTVNITHRLFHLRMALPGLHRLQPNRMIIVKDKVEWVWKEVIMSYSTYLVGPMKTNLSIARYRSENRNQDLKNMK
jgi:hypothetical protein